MKLQLALLGLLAAGAPAAAKGLTIEDMLAMRRVGDPAVSPDGKQVAFAVRDTDLDANRGRFDVWLAQTDGSGARQLTTHPENDQDPQWSADGSWIYFLSSRSGSSQVWRIRPGGGEAEAVTRLPADIGGFKLFPDGKHLVVAVEVWPDAKSIAESVKRDDERAKSKVKARVYDHLLFRHWDHWEDGKYSHLFVWTSPEAGGKLDDARDLMPGQAADAPIQPFGGMDDVSISPDGKSVAFVARASGRENAWRTNTDVFVVPADGHTRPVDVTADNPAYDFGPAFSPDGKSLALRMMKRAGFESDRERIAVLDLASRKLRVVTEGWDRSAGSITWSPDGGTIYTDTDNVGNHSVFAIDVASGKARVVVDKGTNGAPRVAGDRVVFSRDTLRSPTELYSVKPDGGDLRQITHLNDARVKAITWGDYEQFSFKGAKGDTVYGYVIKPAGFTGGGKVPVAFLIHGGPQGSFGDHFHYRWNPEVFAGHGYGVVMVDFHGSTGYGQAFTDAISGDWGGAPYDDLMKGLDAALDEVPVARRDPGRRARRLVRRLHDQLDRRQDRPLQGAGLPRRQPRRADGVLRHRGAVVPRVGARRPAVGEARGLRQAQPDRPREELEDADAGDPRRARLPDPGRPGHGHVHRAAAQGHPEPVPVLPRREPLGAQAAELAAVARGGARLDRPLDPALTRR